MGCLFARLFKEYVPKIYTWIGRHDSSWATFAQLDFTSHDDGLNVHPLLLLSHTVSRGTRMFGIGWSTGPLARAPSTPPCTAATATLRPRLALPSIFTDLVRTAVPGIYSMLQSMFLCDFFYPATDSVFKNLAAKYIYPFPRKKWKLISNYSLCYIFSWNILFMVIFIMIY